MAQLDNILYSARAWSCKTLSIIVPFHVTLGSQAGTSKAGSQSQEKQLAWSRSGEAKVEACRRCVRGARMRFEGRRD